MSGDPIPTTTGVSDAMGAEAMGRSAAAATTTSAAVDGAAVATTAPTIRPARRRALAALAVLDRVVRFSLVLAFFVGGVAFGYQAQLSSQPPPTGPAVDPATAGNQAAPVVREFIAAVGNNDADAIRSTLPMGPYKSFTSEMERWEFQEVTAVETLATFEDGPRTATAFVMIGRTNGGNPVTINLVVETLDGGIVTFK